jgi:hypothetical protein
MVMEETNDESQKNIEVKTDRWLIVLSPLFISVIIYLSYGDIKIPLLCAVLSLFLWGLFQRWFWIVSSFLCGFACLFTLLASIIHFMILGAMTSFIGMIYVFSYFVLLVTKIYKMSKLFLNNILTTKYKVPI